LPVSSLQESAENEYTLIRRSLDSLGYKGSLPLESIPIVSQLLTDLIKATKSFKTLMSEKQQLLNDLNVQNDIVLPLRNENYKLAKDNNELHQELIRIKDIIDLNKNSNDVNLKKLINVNEEMKFVLEQKDKKIKMLQVDKEILRKKLNIIYDKLYMGEGDKSIIGDKGLVKAHKIISNEHPKNVNTTYTKKMFEMNGDLPDDNNNNYEENNNINNNNFNREQQNWINNDIQKASQQIETLKSEINALKDELENKTNIINNYNTIIQTRDDEIKRLQNFTYSNLDNKQELKIRYNVDILEMENEKLKRQNEFLNNENHKLNSIDYFHTHRCREEEVRKLDKEILKLKKENEKLRKYSEFSLNNNNVSRLNTSQNKLKLEKQNVLKLLEQEKKKNEEMNKLIEENKNLMEKHMKDFNDEKNILNENINKLKNELQNEKNTNIK
jgi:hypothetical protein